jgi:hypothetical protein
LTPAEEFWHDLVSAGVGGWTVEEAKERMSWVEARDWAAYTRRRGPLNLGVRLELGFAMLILKIDHALGGKHALKDFMPWGKEPVEEEEGEATLEDFMSILKGAMR